MYCKLPSYQKISGVCIASCILSFFFQIIAMRKSYRQELKMIEDVILSERQLMIDASNKKWEDLYKKRDLEEKANSDLRSEDYWTFVKEMDDLVRDFQELYRETMIKLENDCDELQREMERIKTDAIMNGEKLDYNYQILKKREDENLIIRSQQKRRINKLQDIINSLRKKNNEYHSQTSQQIEKLTVEIKKLSQNILDVEKKADHIALVNNEKFRKIWDMNKERADQLYRRILDIDKTLFEQQLGLIWYEPDEKPPPNTLESFVSTAPGSVTAADSKKSKAVSQVNGDAEVESGDEDNPYYKRTMKHILNLIGDKTGFLVEDELNVILEPYLEQEKTLVKVNNVFAVSKRQI